jgi:hypothetical protein
LPLILTVFCYALATEEAEHLPPTRRATRTLARRAAAHRPRKTLSRKVLDVWLIQFQKTLMPSQH